MKSIVCLIVLMGCFFPRLVSAQEAPNCDVDCGPILPPDPPPPAQPSPTPPQCISFGGGPPFPAIFIARGPFSDVGSGTDGSAWVIGPNGADLAVRGLNTLFSVAHVPSPTPTNTTASRIAVAPDGSPWFTTDDRHIYHFNLQTHQTEAFPGLAIDIAVTSDGSVWVIGTQSTTGGFHIYHWSGSTWVQLSPGSGVRIVGGFGDGGQPWVTNSSGEIYHRNPDGSWSRFPTGLGNDIALDLQQPNGPWVLGTTGIVSGGFPIWRWVGSWVTDPNLIQGGLAIAGGCGGAYIINGDRDLFQI